CLFLSTFQFAKLILPYQTSLDSFIAGFELAWRLSAEVHNDENERSVSCRTRRAGARFVSEESE
ncbi:hypothetical protein DWX58_07725, partial [Pseudoflavonifractor sp. AF19-9AC]